MQQGFYIVGIFRGLRETSFNQQVNGALVVVEIPDDEKGYQMVDLKLSRKELDSDLGKAFREFKENTPILIQFAKRQGITDKGHKWSKLQPLAKPVSPPVQVAAMRAAS